MDIVARNERDDREPSAADLAAIEAEWPLIEAGLAELDAEIAEVRHGVGSRSARQAWRRYRRIARRALRRVPVTVAVVRLLKGVPAAPAVRLAVAA